MLVGCCGHGVDWGAVLPSVIMGISGHPGCAVCSEFMESCLTLSAQSSWLWAAAANLASLLNSAPKGRHHVTLAKTKSWAPLPALGGRRLAQRDRQPLGIPPCCRATKPMHHTIEPVLWSPQELQLMKPAHPRASALQPESSLCLLQLERSPCSNEDPA